MANEQAGSNDEGEQSPQFLGRIVRHPIGTRNVASGLTGAREVWFPISDADVAAAVMLLRTQKVFVRSGTQAAAVTDEVDATGGYVINLAELTKVAVRDGDLAVEVAANTGAVAAALGEQELALPLGDNPHQSIASNVLHDERSCLMRTLGSLSDYVVALNVVTPAGQTMTLEDAHPMTQAEATSAIITEIRFRPAPAKNLWMFRRSFRFPGKDEFASLVRALFLNAKIPPHSDLVLDAFSARHDIPLVRITAAGSSPQDEAGLQVLVDQALAGLPADYAQEIIRENYSGSSVINAIVNGGSGIPRDPQIETRRVRPIIEPDADLSATLGAVTEDIHRGIAFRDDQTGKYDKAMRLFTRLQFNREGRLEVSGLVYTPRRGGSLPASPLASLAPVARARTGLFRDAGLSPAADAEPAPESDLVDSLVPDLSPLLAPQPRIPGFQGDVYIASDSSFKTYATQYATTSFPSADMTPFMLAYPLDETDIKTALAFAKTHGKRVVARSGGHQYCGKSSGGDDTVVLAMDAFHQFRLVSQNVVDVGPAVRLTDLAALFHENEITIPHGECPLVCIGGHAQTGGFGHLLRGFGLALDYVTALTIILADGTEHTLSRPTGPPTTDDDKLFWAILGGNAGSFGIVTNYRIACVQDSDHPHSYGYAATRKYEKARYTSLMKQVQVWTQGVEARTLPAGIDFMMTVESSFAPFLPPIHLVELVHSNLGGAGEVVNGDDVFNDIIQPSDDGAGPWLLSTVKGTESLSELSNSFVRRWPSTTIDGREFKYPYHKRINATSRALTDAFIDKFVHMVDKVVMNTEGVYLVFQMLIGGGNYQNSDRRQETSIPRRDFVYCFIFDLFYDTGYEPTALSLQDEMQAIVDTVYSPDQEQRLFWGSFGDTDMTKPIVQKLYYDDAARYVQLQSLKQKFDPDDLFHTSFTVKGLLP